MADEIHQRRPYSAVRVRSQELIRPADQRRDFTTREARRRLEQKERPRWALIAYGVFLLALLMIFGVTYTTYAFSEYRGDILPGVYVDRTNLGGLTPVQANRRLTNELATVYFRPVLIEYRGLTWNPTPADIGYQPQVLPTVKEAEQVGRHETFFEQLLDRLPIHPDHAVALHYTLDQTRLKAYIRREIVPNRKVSSRRVNAYLSQAGGRIYLHHNQPGSLVDVPATVATIQGALGRLSKQTRQVQVRYLKPVITDAYAESVRQRVVNFLAHTPVISIGKRVFASSRNDFAPAFHFRDQVGAKRATIEITVDSGVLQSYISRLASQVDRPAQNPQIQFTAGKVQVISRLRTGRILDAAGALQKLQRTITALTPNARLHFKVAVTQPPVDTSNPASLGIDSLLGTGISSFVGASDTRLNGITQVADALNKVVIPAGGDISFNTLVTTNWPAYYYNDKERLANGELVPGDDGAIQQVATTFFRALYASGLKLVERYPHVHQLSWFESTLGLDAFVTPDNQKDVVFHNNTGKALLFQTRVEPLRQEVFIYVYGHHLKWRISIDRVGQVSKVYPHGPAVVQEDPSLAPGERHQIAWAHDGADVVIHRTITYPNGNVIVEKLTSHYDPWRAILEVGSPLPSPTPMATTQPGKPTPTRTQTAQTPTPTPLAVTPTPTPAEPTPTPTLSH